MSKKPLIKVLYEVEVRNKQGKLLTKRKGVSKSLLANFMRWFKAKISVTTESVVDTDGTSRTIIYGGTISNHGVAGRINAEDDNDDYGIMVGSGTVAVSPEDYQLASKIAHGIGTGQLDYGTQTFETVVVSNNTSSFRVSRTFTNLSGASISVQELGIAMKTYTTDQTTISILILRDVLASPVSVPDGATLTVRYTFQVTA